LGSADHDYPPFSQDAQIRARKHFWGFFLCEHQIMGCYLKDKVIWQTLKVALTANGELLPDSTCVMFFPMVI